MRKQNCWIFINVWLLVFLFGCSPPISSFPAQTPTATSAYIFVKDPAITPDPADTQPPFCQSIYNDNTIGAAPGTIMEMYVPLVATDAQNVVDYMRYSADNSKHWSEWMPYQSPYKIVVSIPSNWASVGASMQYRDSAGNISQPCTWTQETEGW